MPKTTTLRLSDKDAARLAKLCEGYEENASNMIRHLIRADFKRVEPAHELASVGTLLRYRQKPERAHGA
jgi:hypothetical protein